MSTITTKRLPDPDDDSIEPSVRRFESTLRFWSPILLGAARGIAPYSYPASIGLSTIIGYVLFFIPSLLIATVTADIATGQSIFTTLVTVLSSFGVLISVFSSNILLVFIGSLALYTLLLLTYEPIEPNSKADVFGTKEWKKLSISLAVCSVVFIASGSFIVTGSSIAIASAVLASLWVCRRVAFTVIYDDTRYVVSSPLTETLLASRIPTVVGLFAIFVSEPLVGFGLLSTPFIVGVGYLFWRSNVGRKSGQDLPSIRMHQDSGLPQDMVSDFSAGNAYSATASDKLLRQSVEKFNSLLETEIDTQRRVSVPEGRLTHQQIQTVVSQSESIHSDFRDVAYRPQRFDDALEKIQTYATQYEELLNEEKLYS